MPTTFEWIGESGQVLHANTYGDYTLEELYELDQKLLAHLNEQDGAAVIIMEFQNAPHLSRDVISNLGALTRAVPDDANMALLSILLLHSEIQARIADMFSAISKLPVRVTRSMEEALIIAEQTLQDAQA